MKTVLKIPYILLVAAVCLIGVLLLMTLLPIPGNVRVKIVKSGSMEPAIMTGSIVVIKPEQLYFKGDVVTFGADTKTQIPTTHRIVNIEGKGDAQLFTTKGDANDTEDPAKTSVKDVGGKVILDLPYIGYLLDFAKKPLGFALLVGIPALLIILDEIGKIWSEIRRLKWEKRKGQELKRENTFDPLIVLLILSAPLLGYASRPSTISYYRENEGAVGNLLMASALYPEKLVLSQDTDTMGIQPMVESDTSQLLSENLISQNMDEANKDDVILPVAEETVEEAVDGAEPSDKEEVVAGDEEGAEAPEAAAE